MGTTTTARPSGNPVSSFARGLALLVTGAGLVLRRARLFGLGLIPPLITSVAFLVLFVAGIWLSPRVAIWVTPFADGWDGAEALRALVGLLLVLGLVVLLVLLFTATTLALGAPLYDRISEQVDAQAGAYDPARPQPMMAALLATGKHLVQVIAISVPIAVGLLLIGLIPVIGGVIAALGSVVFGGWMIALEMITSAADRRGIRTLAARHRLLRSDPWLALGFGIPTFLLLSVPALALVVFPIATAGGTLLTRRLVAR